VSIDLTWVRHHKSASTADPDAPNRRAEGFLTPDGAFERRLPDLEAAVA
jgi:hypothetical protein